MIENVLIQVLRLVVVDQKNQNFNLVFLGSDMGPYSESREVWMEKNPHLRQLPLLKYTPKFVKTLKCVSWWKIDLHINLVGRRFGAQTLAIKPC